MRSATVEFRGEESGVLTQFDDGTFAFRYLDNWLINSEKPSISLTLPKSKKNFESKYLFPFFFHMLPEGRNKEIICRLHRIDVDDHMGLLLIAAQADTIGAVKISRKSDHAVT